MTAVLVRAGGPVTLVGGGPVSAEALAEALALAPEAVAADGGGDVALPGGRRFAAVIGDMDSLQSAERLRAERVPVHRLPEQETTDLEKCLYSVAAPLYVGVGFLGGWADHHLAAMNALARYSARAVILLGSVDLAFRWPEGIALDLPEGTRVSFFPMGRARGVACEGLVWPVTGLDFAPDGRIGTSNRTDGRRVSARFQGGPMIAILPRAALGQVARSLAPGL